MGRTLSHLLLTVGLTLSFAGSGFGAGTGAGLTVTGVVTDETGLVLPGVTVELRTPAGITSQRGATDAEGRYRLDVEVPGQYEVVFRLVNFGTHVQRIAVTPGTDVRVDVKLAITLATEVTVSGRGTFRNLADAPDPQANLVGVALAASQGAVTARQLDVRPFMRAGEVLETVPGVVITQHSGEGKANQYYLRGFNLDHGTDFAMSVAGVPVNLPTHAHGHGYADVSFLIPELISGVQFMKGPYFADQGDFSAAGAATINYLSRLDEPLVQVGGGPDRWGRFLAAASPRVWRGHLLGAVELHRGDGPWEQPEDLRRFNGVVRYSEGDSLNNLAVTAMSYRGRWDATDQVPARAVESGRISRLGLIDPTGGGDSYRHSVSAEYQRSHGAASSRVSAFVLGYGLNLFSNFTYFLEDPVNGDQFEQEDRRIVTGVRASRRWLETWNDRAVEHTAGGQVRHDAIGELGLYATRARERLEAVRRDEVGQTSWSGWYQGQIEWSPLVRALGGVRADVYRFRVDSDLDANSGRDSAGLLSPKAGVAVGPWHASEVYVNAGYGFHSNDARGATLAIDPATGEPAERVTPLARARGAEIGFRTVAIPRLQSTLALWRLGLDSELVFEGDAGTTEASRPSRRYGLELTNYYRPLSWLTLDADLSWSSARFTDDDPEGHQIPGAVGTVLALGASVTDWRGGFGSVRLRRFGPRPLIEDGSERSSATTLVNLEAGYQVRPGVRVFLDVFNLFNAEHSDVDYFYESRLPGEPAEGIADRHFHPVLPRTARAAVTLTF